ncbi:MAG: hypothetical protein ACPGZP_06885 [Panacagrimonas sp.]
MNIRSWLLSLSLLLVALGLVEFWLVQRAHQAMRELRTSLVAHGELRYQRLWPWLWGAGRVEGLSFEPAGLLQSQTGLPQGYRIQIEKLTVERIDPGWIGDSVAVRGRMLGLKLPLIEPADSPAPDRPPILTELGYQQWVFDFDYQARYLPAAKMWVLQLEGFGDDFVSLSASLTLGGDLALLQNAPDQIRLARLALSVEDAGLWDRYRAVSEQRGFDQAALADYWNQHIERLPDAQGWDAQRRNALHAVIDEQRGFEVVLEPPGEMLLRNLRLSPFHTWPKGFGLTLKQKGPDFSGP